MFKIFLWICLFIFFNLFFLTLYTYPGQAGYSKQEARKVLDLIRKMQLAQPQPDNRPIRKVIVSESELNAYIAYRIESEKEEVMKELRLKLLADNYIEGKVYFDLEGQNLPKLLRPDMTFYFRANMEIKEGFVRFNLKDLFLDSQRIKPMVLDMVFFIAAKVSNSEFSSFKNWFELPYGIKNIQTKKGLAEFYY